MGLVLFASTLFLLGCALAYADEISRAVAAVGVGRPSPAAAGGGLGLVGVPPGPASILASLVRDLESPDPRRWERALERLPAYPPGELSRALIPLLDGPPTELRDRIADLLLRQGGEDVLEPLHRYFLEREGSLEASAEATASSPATPREARPRAERRGNVIFLRRRPPALGSKDLSPPRRRSETPAPSASPYPLPVLSLDPALRARAMADLPGTGHPQAWDLLTKVVRGDPDALVRAAAAAALGGAGDHPDALAALEDGARDRDPSVRWNACYALGKLGRLEAKAALRRAENDVDGSVRMAARKALEALGLDPPVPAAVPEPVRY